MKRPRPCKAAPIAILLAVLCLAWPAAGRAPADPYAFGGHQAFAYLKRLVDFGPRPAGSPALAASRKWILEELHSDGCGIEQDAFTAQTPLGDIPMINLICKLPGTERPIVMIAGHYDTKREEKFKFVGANDGGSSAAFLLELARVLAHQPHRLTYWLVFFDGEEAMAHWTDSDSLYGSRHLASKLTHDGLLGRIQAMILADMIGGAHLDIERDTNSTAWLNDLVFSTARRLGYGKYFLSNQPTSIEDDHLPFVQAGVSAVDLLGPVGPVAPQASFGIYWHTAQDVPAHCSPASLTIVGRVVRAVLIKLDKKPPQ